MNISQVNNLAMFAIDQYISPKNVKRIGAAVTVAGLAAKTLGFCSKNKAHGLLAAGISIAVGSYCRIAPLIVLPSLALFGNQLIERRKQVWQCMNLHLVSHINLRDIWNGNFSALCPHLVSSIDLNRMLKALFG